MARFTPNTSSYRARRLLLALVVTFGFGSAAVADDRDQIEFFERRIRPVLIQSCYRCHSGRSDEPEGGLRLDSRRAILRGGESGPAIVPGRPGDSLLIQALRYESLEMPPQNKLPDEVILDFAKWVELGAIDPRDEPDSTTDADSWTTILESRRDWWSLQPVANPKIPDTGDSWPRLSLDQFILAKLENAGLRPAAIAPPRQLVRRLSLVLTGLPPTVAEVEKFVSQHERDADTACDLLVERLLDSKHFGERWARHWMDVVRFTETHGNEWNYEVHHAWQYRDYLIRAFNTDVPYDQFIREHIAGDLVASPRWNYQEQINESLIGTSFYRFGEVNHDDCVTLTSLGYDILDNQIDTLSKAFQATTVACARCHHHKIDPVSMQDYYALLGILKSSRLTAHTIDAETVNSDSIDELRALKVRIKSQVTQSWLAQSDAIASYLLAADAIINDHEDAAVFAQGLVTNRLDKWVAAFSGENLQIQDPAWAWRHSAGVGDFSSRWNELRETFRTTRQEYADSNEREFSLFADFGNQGRDQWTSSGQGLRDPASPSGEFTISHEGDAAIASILPAGRYTHLWSQKLNGTLRSPVLPAGSKHISTLVLGDKTSAFRLISNNCQLNYANYRALTSSQPTWVTFQVPANARELRTFAELVTKFNNPKFPDQLGTLGGDRTNDRIPWAEAAADPRSYFGLLRVVTHDDPQPPKPDLSALARLFAPGIAAPQELAQGYSSAIRSSVQAWANEQATDDDVFWLAWVAQYDLLDHSSTSPELAELVAQYRRIEDDKIKLPRVAPGLTDFDDGQDHPLLERGNFETPLEAVPRRYLEVLSRRTQPFQSTGSGRSELAEAIASADNPLTARVIVNRVWHLLFGTGIVRTVDDFGHVGELPSHPDLLDHLSTRFVTATADGGWGWSMKNLIREIVRSKTFRMSSHASAAARTTDPLNRLLYSYPTRRMEAEAIRDSMLFVSGQLDRELYGMSVQPYRSEPNAFRRLFPGPLDGNGRRSIYIKVNLMEPPQFLSAFNIPGGKVTQGKRDVTNVPAQALTLLNDAFVFEQASAWAQSLILDPTESVRERLGSMFHDALGRPASPAELARFTRLVKDLAELHAVTSDEVMIHQPTWKDIAHVLFNLKEFIYIP